ncbi:MAG: hypothetical protein V1762_00770 [Nitrospirota bacterium]
MNHARSYRYHGARRLTTKSFGLHLCHTCYPSHLKILPHSYLNAFIGSYSDAFLAGYTPKNIPTAAENKKATITDHRARCVGRTSTALKVLLRIKNITKRIIAEKNQKLRFL